MHQLVTGTTNGKKKFCEGGVYRVFTRQGSLTRATQLCAPESRVRALPATPSFPQRIYRPDAALQGSQRQVRNQYSLSDNCSRQLPGVPAGVTTPSQSLECV